MNMLITNVGRRGYLVDFLRNGGGWNGNKIFVSDCDISAVGLYSENDGYFILPRVSDGEELYVSKLLQCCKENNISVVVPVIDPEIYVLSAHREEFRQNGINVVVSDRSVLETCYNKVAMNEFLDKNGLAHPLTFDSIQAFEAALTAGKIDFPVIIKPIYGSGSAETYVLDSMNKIQALFHDGLIIQEFLKGDEYGADVFNTFDKKPIRCVVKKKISMRSGETDKSVTVKNELVQTTALRIANTLGHIGNLDCDMMLSNGKVYVLDLNPRFGGGYVATHAAGVNLLEILIKLINGENVREDFSSYRENLLVMKTIGVQTAIINNN